MDEPYGSYETSSEGARFTDWLRNEAGELWAQATEHRFTRDIANGVLPERVFRTCVIQEYAFVETSATVIGYTVAKAPSMIQKAHLAKALMGLTTEQESFFQQAFQQLSVQREDWVAPPLPTIVEAFRDYVIQTAATGTYEESLTNMLGAEWMYLTWCQRVRQRPLADPLIQEWVDLHITEAFENGVVWMRGQLDRIGPSLIPERQEALAKCFQRTLELEIEFHNAPYDHWEQSKMFRSQQQ